MSSSLMSPAGTLPLYHLRQEAVDDDQWTKVIIAFTCGLLLGIAIAAALAWFAIRWSTGGAI